MNSNVKNLLLALVLTAVLMTLLVVANINFPGRVWQLLGGEMPLGVVQQITYFLAIFALLEIRQKRKEVDRQYKGLSLKLLPEKEQYVLAPDDINEIKLAVIEQEKTEKFMLTDIIKKACTKYRSEKSVSQVMDVVEAQSRIGLNRAESEQSMIRYVAWAIPSVGFIGTIIGIASSLGYADQISGDGEGISLVTGALNVAFDTTLVSLFLSIVLMYFFHAFQEKTERLYSDVEEYVLENLVNRINPE
jgi:biopolymer transport protein ExbB/TolQ